MSRTASCLLLLAGLVATSGCNCFGSSCRQPSFMEFGSPCRSDCFEMRSSCGPACGPMTDGCSECGGQTVVFE